MVDAKPIEVAGKELRTVYPSILIIPPFAKTNFVDHTLTDQSSVLRFIEDNWKTGRTGGGSFDQIAGSLLNMFNFGDDDNDGNSRLILDPATGLVVGGDHDTLHPSDLGKRF